VPVFLFYARLKYVNILLVTDSYSPEINGTAIFVRDFALKLAQDGHEVTVWTTGNKLYRTFTVVNQTKGIKIIREPSVPLFFNTNNKVSIRPYLYAKKLIQKQNPDVIHIHTPGLMGLTALVWAKVFKMPVVATNHIMAESVSYNLKVISFLRPVFNVLLWRGLAFFYNFASLTVSPSEAAYRFIKQSGFKKPAVIISNGINTVNFKPKIPAANIYKKYSLPADMPVLLYLGRLDFEKRVDAIIGALPEIIKYRSVRLMLAGDGNAADSLKRQVERLGLGQNVTFTGFVGAKKIDLYNAANVFVSVCPTEMQGIATLEAMSCGLPVVTVKNSGTAELCYENFNGYISPTLKSFDIACSVLKILNSPVRAKWMGHNSRFIAEKFHSFEKTMTDYKDVYKKIATEKSPVLLRQFLSRPDEQQ
jgi:phosphatidylinositol alpha 1,6-mannosyltransferase